MFDKPEGVTSPFYYCGECDLVLNGPVREAAAHFEEPERWGHWLWELRFTADARFPYHATGSEAHTSDQGGFYYSQDAPTHTPAGVYEHLARGLVNRALRGNPGS